MTTENRKFLAIFGRTLTIIGAMLGVATLVNAQNSPLSWPHLMGIMVSFSYMLAGSLIVKRTG